jgi:hypothetical protein
VAPTFGARTAGRGIAAFEESLKGPPEGIIRPFGGASAVARPEQKNYGSLNQQLERAVKSVQEDPNFADPDTVTEAAKMFDVKARNWLNEQAGTANDPLKQKIYSGSLKLPTSQKTTFPSYLIEAARKGNQEAQLDIEDRYDAMLGIMLRRMQQPGVELDAVRRDSSLDNRMKILQQLKANPELIPDQYVQAVFKNKDPKEVKQKLKEAPEIFSARMEPYLNELILKNMEPVTPAKNIPEEIGDVGVEAVNRGEDFFTGGNNSRITQRDKYVIGGEGLFGYDFKELANAAPSIPLEELRKMSFPDYVERATKILAQRKEADDIGLAMAKMLKANPEAALPKEYMLKGFSSAPVVSAGPSQGAIPFKDPIRALNWHKVVDPSAVKTIANTMSNSVGAYANYGTYGSSKVPGLTGRKALEAGEAEVYVLYDDKFRPHMTAELVDGATRIGQITGNGPLTINASPGPYLSDAVTKFKEWVAQKPKNPIKKAQGGLVSKPLYDRA